MPTVVPRQPCSFAWFRVYMQLPGNGIVPMVTPNELMPSREIMAMYWGPKTSSGFTFHNHGSWEFEEYVRELYSRVLQQKWPQNSLLPFHFARGLVAEAMDQDVNWAEFAVKVTHPHQWRHSSAPRLLPEYAELTAPLPPLKKVIPLPNFQVRFPLSCFNS